MLCTWPRGEVVTAFSDQLQREVRTEAVDRGDVLSEQREQRLADVESQSVRLIGSIPTLRAYLRRGGSVTKAEVSRSRACRMRSRRCRAETPLIAPFRLAGPALSSTTCRSPG